MVPICHRLTGKPLNTAEIPGAMSEIRLADGHGIGLTRLYQSYTYEGVLAGLPTPPSRSLRRRSNMCKDG